MINVAIYQTLRSKLVGDMAQNPYLFVNDSSDDSGLSKVNPIYIYISDMERKKTRIQILFNAFIWWETLLKTENSI